MADSHPIVQALGLSEQQLAAIRGLADDALITAGAGTGKTRTLTARYLQLLARGVPLRGIVAITFTRKAAREMRNRIRKQVWAYLSTPGLSEAERERWGDIANRLDAARISTIHGLCQEILRTHPAEARVDPDFQTLEESKTLLLQEESVDEALFWAAGQAHLADLLATEGESAVRAGVKALLFRGSEARALLQSLPDEPQALLDAWESWLLRAQRSRLDEVMADPPWQEAREIVEAASPRDRSDRLAMQQAVAKEALALLARADAQFRVGAQALAGIDLRGGKMGAWPGGKDEKKAVSGALKQLREPFKQERWLGEALNPQDERSARALVQLRAIALQAMTIYEARKADLQALDFDDLEDRAIRLLSERESVRAWWQSQVQALLVDEFQDTNARQTHLLALLDGGRGVRFLVGDGKQSIYRFRGADVAVFQTLRADFEARGKRVAPLDETWRAHAALVDGLNALLAPVLGEARYPWEAPFEPLQPARPAGPRCPESSFIEFLLASGGKSEGGLARAARAVAGRLRQLFADGRCKPGDVAILTRASTSFSAYEDALDAAGIPFLTLAGRGFYQRPEIRDLVAVMRAAADPTDDVALAGALRSPGLGLSDVALYQLARQRDALRSDKDAPRPPLWETLNGDVEALTEVDRPRAERARALIRQLNGMAGRASVADLLKHYLDETDYLAILVAAGQERAARNVSKLLEEAGRAGFVQVEAFVEYVKLARATAVREGEAPVVAEGAVQIMSVHRAKGLEFPIVVLGDVTYQGRRRGGLLMTEGQVAWQLPLPPGEKQKPVFYEALGQLAQRQEEAEEKRLLYVAATRAQEHLLVSGVASKRGWLKLLAQAVPLDESCFDGEEDLSVARDGVVCTIIGPDWVPDEELLSGPSAELDPPRFDPAMLKAIDAGKEVVDEKRKAAEEKPERRVWRVLPPAGQKAWAPAWVVGSLVHRAIELERFPDDPRFADWFRASARGLGLSDESMLANALWRARNTLSALQASDFWQTILSSQQRLHEIPYAYTDAKGCIDRGTIDIAWRQDGRWHLADFKTDRVQNREAMLARIEEKKYDEQVQRYIRAMAATLGETPIACLCFLDVAGEVTTIVVE